MYKSLDVLNSGWGVVPNSVVYKYSDPKIQDWSLLGMATVRPVVLLHVPLPGLGRERVEYLCSAQIFY